MLTTLSKHKVRREQAITIIELIGVLIVVTTVAVLIIAVLAIPRINDTNDKSRARSMAARANIAQLTTMLRKYKADTGTYPNATNAWQDLRIQPRGVTNWHGPYLEDIPFDSWGHEYVYKYPGKHPSTGYPYDIYSLGPGPSNGILGNWEIPSLQP